MAKPITLTGTPQNFTASWVDLGTEIITDGASEICLWLNVDANDSTDMDFRFIFKHESAGADEYTPVIKTETASVIAVEDEYYELTDDSDQKIVIGKALNGGIPYVQIQIKAGTVGASAGQIDDAKYTLVF